MEIEPVQLTKAAPAEVGQALAYALRFRAGKRALSGDELMAQTTTARLIEHLEQSGFLKMRKPAIEGSAIRQAGQT